MTIRAIKQPDGAALDATFEVQVTDEGTTVVVESRGGTRGEPNARNLDYAKGLELLLTRLRDRNARIVDAIVDSVATRTLPPGARRLEVDGKPYPIAIDDPSDLQRRFGAAQARVGRKPGAKGSGNPTRRVRLLLEFAGVPPSEATLEAELAGPVAVIAGGWPTTASSGTRPIGRTYANVGKVARSAPRDPFETDPDKVDRGNQAHADTQDALADFLRGHGVKPLAPAPDDPEFDLCWEHGGTIYVAEVKSITGANEEKQLRLGLGQVLRYRQALASGECRSVAVLVAERKPDDGGWLTLCKELDVVLAWPGDFNVLIPGGPKSGHQHEETGP